MDEAWGPEGHELVTRGTLLAAIRSAPWTVWGGTGILLGQRVAWAVLVPRVPSLVLLPFAFVFAAMVLAGMRVLWQMLLVFAVGDIVFAFAPPAAIWDLPIGVAALVLLLLPSARRYFRPGRTWLPVRLEGMSYEDWERGGLRHLKLKERLPAYLAPRKVGAFFVACRGRGRRWTFSHFLRREYAIAAADDAVVVVRLRRPAVFGARLAGVDADLPAEDPRLDWDDEAFAIDGRDYRPIPHQEAPADEVARRLRFAREDRTNRR